MQSCAVEAEFHGFEDIVFEILVGRRGVDAVGVEALIQHPTAEHDPPVDAEGSADQRNASQTKIACYAVNGLAAARKDVFHVVEVAHADVPQVLFGERDGDGNAVSGDSLCGRRSDLFAPEGHADGKICARRVAGKAAFGCNRAGGGVRRGAQTFDVQILNGFHPDGLPDARGAGIGAAVGGVAVGLLACGLIMGAHVVEGGEGHAVMLEVQEVGDIEAERGIAAGVRADLLAVDPDGCEVIDRAEVEQDTLALPCGGDIEILCVPDAPHEVGMRHARQAAFGAERDGDLPAEVFRCGESARLAAFSRVNLEFPCAVEALPGLAHQLRAGVLASRNLCHVSSPFLMMCGR